MKMPEVSSAEQSVTRDALSLRSCQRPVRVVHLLHTVAYGGVETLVLNWTRSLDPARVDVMVVCFANSDHSERPFEVAAKRLGIQVKKIPWGRAKPVLRSARALSILLKDFDAEVVHTHNFYAELVGWIAARRCGVKIMSTQYVWSDFGWKRNVLQWFAARLLRRFDMVTSQCHTTMYDTIRRGVRADIQSVLSSGIERVTDRPDSGLRTAIRMKHGSGPDDLVLINVARLYPEKAQGLLLEWFAEIVRLRPHTKLWILGVGPLENALKEHAIALGLERHVVFLGFLSDLPPTLLSADIQVHSSYAEGIPLAICTGMAAGMPIVATAVGGVPEIVQHEKTGLLVPSADGPAFVSQTIRLIDDASLRETLSRQAREAAETELSLERSVTLLTSKYEVLVGR